MSNEIVIRSQYVPQTFEDIERLGKAMAQSGFFKDTRDAGQAVVKILAGQELGVPPVAAMRGLHVIEGKIELSGTLIGALIKRSVHYDYRIAESTDEKCVITFRQRPGEGAQWEDIGTSTWTTENAARAGLCRIEDGKVVARSKDGKKKPWETYTRAMLFNRAMAEGARMHCPDIFDGPIYSEGEIGETIEGEAVEVGDDLIVGAVEEGSEAAGQESSAVPAEPEPSSAQLSKSSMGEMVEDPPTPAVEDAGDGPAADAEPDTATAADIAALVEQLGWNDGKLMLFARRNAGLGDKVKHPKDIAKLSGEDAAKLADALRGETT